MMGPPISLATVAADAGVIRLAAKVAVATKRTVAKDHHLRRGARSFPGFCNADERFMGQPFIQVNRSEDSSIDG
ncbi:hypothetical protein GCM10027598_84440 [Amycolatopsis oliviviridis]|uniref:Uncharacterized protein n=1 Tax=Amycolatopsis oliviviridis TaxID=1471590 RepID=A0ABQ3LD82_9PSEU|nr:hypothetical protein GCM10017790_14340 [Amycolatopsis oliviviridis]